MTERTEDVHADEVFGQCFPLMTPVFNSVGEMISLSDVQDLQPLSSNVFEPWMMPAFPEGSPLCDEVIRAFTAERMPWDVLSPLGPGFERQSISQSVYEDPNDATLVCQWCDNGSPCNMPYSPGKNQKHSIAQHFNKVHHLSVGGKLPQRCLWLGCTKELKQESLVRHILTVHLRVKSACEGCGTSFARPDSLQRHMKKSCGAGNEER
ncbi:hypothetical protein L210DRAFT_3118403 [Boletus edulis BED1]|uniref:C2H2-type domain-containing protein n=1 Tax=Boletus edulis BED1 TaxID=1328754 RepID=A0AAD4G959_BOLED|nr:hypothetical protein L210DRAFT_3118403 [Boletus edulis BED1]